MRSRLRQENEDGLAPTRATLLSRLKSVEDHASWQEFFDTYWKLIYSIALQAGLSEADAREVVQETVISLTQQIPKFQYDPKRGSFKSWLYRQTQWRVLDYLKKRKALREDFSDDTGSGTPWLERIPSEDQAITERQWDHEWERNLMDLALERMKRSVSPKQYQIFDLHVVRELPVREVMETLNVTRAQVYLAKHRLRKWLASEVQQIRKQIEPAPSPES